MVAEPQWIDAIVAGVNPQPHCIPTRAVFEYSNGLVLNFGGTVLHDLWLEFMMFKGILMQMRAGPPSINADDFRTSMRKVIEKKGNNEKEKEEE